MKKAAVYIHGKGGSADEAHYYKKFFDDEYDIIGFDYKSELPWEVKVEFQKYFIDIFSKYNEVVLIANSIGAYFSLISISLYGNFIKKAMFISPVVDMEQLILDIMKKAGVSEKELSLKKIINTSFGESLSWEYLSYVRNNPIKWNIPSSILYGKNDNITSLKIISDFANRINADLTVMDNGEHRFYTEKQMIFMDNWFKKFI
jgi:hydrolase